MHRAPASGIPGRSPTQRSGDAAESLALQFLQQRGLHLVERNAGSRFGEIDLVMRSDDCWIFVEVRRRASARFGGAAASVTWDKQRKLRRAANAWLGAHFGTRRWPRCRFDVVAVDGGTLDDATIDWIVDAF